jgi:hypothetical protein
MYCILRLKGNNMVIQGLTQRTAMIETAICNAKWKSRNIGQSPTEKDRVRITEREKIKQNTHKSTERKSRSGFRNRNTLP